MFRRRRRAGEEEQAEVQAAEPAESTAESTSGKPAESDGSGPWDAAQAYPDVPRVDLGGLLLPIGPGFEVQLSVQGDRMVAATVLAEESALLLQAFAAPRRGDLWDELRGDLKREVSAAGGEATEKQGPFGPELVAVRPGDGRAGKQQVRYLGVDGQRWCLRADISGRAALDQAAAAVMEGVLRNVVVVRGDQPMAPKEPIELRLPAEARQQQDDPEVETFRPFERGPEISEIR
ncbi:DUF3710 domain-containing protein [Streptosporangiaceae bacterium NEAU-GS5]|nr:DUF3710 domain-containing protein [Streptosporangiaceae bacterium NEAU-GS5]